MNATLTYHLEVLDSDGESVQSTGDLGPVDVVAELQLCEGVTDEQVAAVFPVLAAPGVVTVTLAGGWSFTLTSEVER